MKCRQNSRTWRCPDEPVPGLLTCERHLRQNRAWARKAYAKRTEAGKCGWCALPAALGKLMCDHHLRYTRDQRTERSNHNRRLTDAAKDRPCADCGVRYPPYVMDFDHRDPEQKVMSVSQMVRDASQARIEAEIDKCAVVCSNCHRERTHGLGEN